MTKVREADRGLVLLAGQGFSIVSHTDSKQSFGRDASGMPLIVWPNGHWCYPANAFMLRLVDKGLSRFNRGGTLGTYAAHISHLLRYCADNQRDLIELSDTHFTIFVNSLKAARYSPGSVAPRLDPSTVIAIANTCLSFLSFVGKLYDVNLVGSDGAIRAELQPSRSRGHNVAAWHHHSFPTRSPERRRLPIGSEAIAKLQAAAAEASTSNYIMRRRQVMLRLLEITGGRRSEVAGLTVSSVQRAAAMQAPRIELITKKGRGRNKNRTREIPIGKGDVRLLVEFLRVNRAAVIRRTCGTRRDSGALLISETTGFELRPNTITQEMALLVHVADLETRACSHMFRHRFLTSIFKALIEEYEVDSPDAFRRLLLSTEELKVRVCQWSGHSSIASLSRYIHLAYEEIGGLGLSVSAVRARSAMESFASEIQGLDFSAMTAAQFQALKQSARELSEELSIKKRSMATMKTQPRH